MKQVLSVFIMMVTVNISFAQTITIETKQGKSGAHYTFINENKCAIIFTDKRPDNNDKTILACIPAAFTNLQNYKVDGIYAIYGKTENRSVINTTLGGVFYIEKNKCKIFQSGKGKLFNDSLLNVAIANHASFFQQIQCIQNGKAATFTDKKIFQRRGIAILKDNTIAIIESKEAITLKIFSEDLVVLGVVQLIYTDMGAWDEGMYKEPTSGKKIVIGKDFSQTSKQSNWIIFKKQFLSILFLVPRFSKYPLKINTLILNNLTYLTEN